MNYPFEEFNILIDTLFIIPQNLVTVSIFLKIHLLVNVNFSGVVR